MPQQTNAGRRTKLERIVQQIEIGALSFDEACHAVGKDGFTDVVPRFHNIGADSNFASNYFYETDFGKKLKSLFYSSNKPDFEEIDAEVYRCDLK